MSRLWAAAANNFGTADEEVLFTIYGPTLNPDCMEWYFSLSLLEAVDFAASWFNQEPFPYWAVVRGPNGKVVIGSSELERIYHAEMRARGITVTTMMVIPSDAFLTAGGTTIRLAQVTSIRRVV